MKKQKLFSIIFAFCLVLVLLLPDTSAYADSDTDIQYFANGDYIETIITIDPSPRANIRSGKKTSTYKNANGDSLWSVTVQGSFSYVFAVSSTCTSSSGSSESYTSDWKVSTPIASKSGSSARATATGTQYLGLYPIGSVEKTVTLSCDVNGNLY